MSLLSDPSSEPNASIRAGLPPEPKFRLIDFVMAPFRDVDGRVDREQSARLAAKAASRRRKEDR
jgi:hypothetical protein